MSRGIIRKKWFNKLSKFIEGSMMLKFNIELTDKCNAVCPFCDHVIKSDRIVNTELTVSNIKHFFDQLNVRYILLSGVFGDPIFCKDLIPIVHYFSNKGVEVEICTNGSKNGIWKELSAKNVEIVFAIDGITQETHAKHRVGINLHTVLNNAQEFIDAGGRAIWQFIPFKHNEHEINEARVLSKAMGFERFKLRPSRGYNDSCEQPIQNIKKRKFFRKDYGTCKYKKERRYQIMATGQMHQCCYVPSTYDYFFDSNDDLNIKNQSFIEIIKHKMWSSVGSWSVCSKFCSY